MSDLSFTVRKQQAWLTISNDLLVRGMVHDVPRFRWPSFVCSYEFSDDYYTEGHSCELPAWHVLDGTPHSCSLEWETRPSDVCRYEGHVGEWESTRTYSGWDINTEWKVRPEEWRRCERCGAREFRGGERDTAYSDALVRSILP